MKTKEIGIILLISLLALAVMFGGNLKSLSIVTEIGWIPFADVSDSFTNYDYQVFDTYSSRGTHLTRSEIYDSKYWLITLGDFWGISLSGGDSNPLVSQNYDVYTGFSSSPTVKFKENLKGKNFAVNYVTTCSIKKTSGICKFNIAGKIISSAGFGRIEFTPSVIDDSTSVFINGEKVASLSEDQIYFTVQISSSGASGTLELINPRWKPLFDCTIDNDEVLIFDEFAEGSSFNINDLSYPVQKFCINQPPIIRSFTEKGITTDKNGEILLKLRDGGTINVKDGQSIRVPYITKYTDAVLRCGVNEAFNTQTSKCENILSEGTDEDIGTTVLTIGISENEFLFLQDYTTSSINIGDLNLRVSPPSYVCPCIEEGRINPPKPSDECWQSDINGNKVINNQEIKLNEFISILYNVGGLGVYNGIKDERTYRCEYQKPSHWRNILKVTIDPEGLSILPKSKITGYIFGSQESITFIVDNKIANFQESGVKIRTVTELLDQVIDDYQEISLSKGIKEYSINIPTSHLGKNRIEIIPYMTIGDKKVYGTTKLVSSYYVANTETELLELVPAEQISTGTLPSVLKTKVGYGAMSIIFSIVLIVALIIYFFVRKK